MERQRWADSKVYTRKSFKGLKTQNSLEHEPNSGKELLFNRFEVTSDDSSSLNRVKAGNPVHGEMRIGNGVGGMGFLWAGNRVLISLELKSRKERRELRRRLEGELHLVRNWVRKIERNGNSRPVVDEDGDGGKLKRVHSEVGSVGGHVIAPPLENSSVASDNVEKEKRTPKANPFYRNPDFILGKDTSASHPEQNKKSKTDAKKSGELTSGIGMGNTWSKVFKSCSGLLDRLMKHKNAWVFNKPVDVKGLGLHDYFNIIKHPMDLGTVKSRLNTSWYKFPIDFADDVRLTFQNAMTYNPKGHDVHSMAEQLLKIFEEKWPSIEAEYFRDLRLGAEYEASLPNPTSRMAPPRPPQLLPPLGMTRALDRSESMTNPVGPETKNTSTVASAKTPAAKKPKAKDLHKRDMTYDEKQKLSTSLQSLPSEKLDNVVQIIRKRNPSVCQQDDEIEVDIDSVEAETLWELDRFVMNFRKNLSKIKRKTELAQSKPEAERNVPEKVEDEETTRAEEPTQTKSVENKNTVSSPVRVEKEGNASRSNSSSSSRGDSGSSSSGESDTDSSSA